jgi:hypothetical protein
VRDDSLVCLAKARGEVLGSAGKMEMGVVAWFRLGEKIRFRVFVVAIIFCL